VRKTALLTKQELYTLLDRQRIAYEVVEHPAVYTMEEMDALNLPGPDRVLKNLFLRDDKRRNYYLVSLPGWKQLDLKTLRQRLSSRPLSFAKPEELEGMLHLKPGHVTPLAVLNDESQSVTVVFETSLIGETVGVHPLENTATVFLAANDLIGMIRAHGNPVIQCEL